MEIGSDEHRSLLKRAILKTAMKQLVFGITVAAILMLPSLLRENAFSRGLFLTGLIVLILTVSYTLFLALKKYRATLASLAKRNP